MAKSYKVKEMFYTLQGEGFHSGRPAVFCRFTGCNLWSGREEDRSEAICWFCDTDFVGTDGYNGGKYSAVELAQMITSLYNQKSNPFVVITGGEPALQLDQELVDTLHLYNIEIAIETNGTKELPNNIDWVCVSPKESAAIVIKSGNELKLVYPQSHNKPSDFNDLAFDHFYIQPRDDEFQSKHIQASIAFCLDNPQWKLSLQTHKILGID
jgi:7-carboxy-7-deazaguanine synthase